MDSLQNFTLKKILTAMLIGLPLFCWGIVCPAQNSSGQMERNIVPAQFNECWSFPFESANFPRFETASDNAKGSGRHDIFIISQSGRLSKINSQLGKIDWQTDLGGENISNPVFIDQKVYLSVRLTLPNQDEGNRKNDNGTYSAIRALDTATGITLWETKLPSVNKGYLFDYAGDLIFVGQEGLIYRFQAEKRQISWNYNLKSRVSSKPLLVGNSLILVSADQTIVRLRIGGEKPDYAIRLSAVPISVAAKMNSEAVFLGDEKGTVRAFFTAPTGAGKEKWSFRSGAAVAHITPTSRGLLISSFDNFAYLISERNGDVVWKRRFPGRLSFEPLITGDLAVIVADSAPEAFIINLSEGKLAGKIPAGAGGAFAASPLKTGNKIIFPTLRGLSAFSRENCDN